MADEQNGEQQMTGTEFMTVQDFTNALQNIKSYITTFFDEESVQTEFANKIIKRFLEPELSATFKYVSTASGTYDASGDDKFPEPSAEIYGHAYLDVADGRFDPVGLRPRNQIAICLPRKQEIDPVEHVIGLKPRWYRLLTVPLDDVGTPAAMIDALPPGDSDKKIEPSVSTIVERLNALTTVYKMLADRLEAIYNSFCITTPKANPWFTQEKPDVPFYGQIMPSGNCVAIYLPNSGWTQLCCGDCGGGGGGGGGNYWVTNGDATTCHGSSIKIGDVTISSTTSN